MKDFIGKVVYIRKVDMLGIVVDAIEAGEGSPADEQGCSHSIILKTIDELSHEETLIFCAVNFSDVEVSYFH